MSEKTTFPCIVRTGLGTPVGIAHNMDEWIMLSQLATFVSIWPPLIFGVLASVGILLWLIHELGGKCV